MSERKNIDRLFQEKFKDFEAGPPIDAWENIEARLRKKKRRRVVPFWFQLSGVAAALVLGWLVYTGYMNNSEDQNSVVDQQETTAPVNAPGQLITSDPLEAVATEDYNTEDNALRTPVNQDLNSEQHKNAGNSQQKKPENSVNKINNRTRIVNKGHKANRDRQQNPATAVANNENGANEADLEQRREKLISDPHTRKIESANPQGQVAHRESKNNRATEDRNAVDTTSDLKPEEQNLDLTQQFAGTTRNDSLSEDQSMIVTNASDLEKIDTTAIATVVPNSLEELLNEKENNVTEEPKVNRWQVSSNVAPIYFSSNSNGSPIDPEFSQNSKEFKQNLAYGLGVSYAINKKISIRTGINTIPMEYSTNDVVIYQNSNARPLKNVDTNLQGSVLQVENKRPGELTEITANANPMQKFDATINQRTGYIEIPVELSYRLLDKKFGIDIIGGVSTLLLNENEISVMSSGTEMEIGKASNLNSTHFSTNLGVGVRYNFFKSFQLNFEPMFKYQINTFTDAGNFKPYFFGLYTGINYRF